MRLWRSRPRKNFDFDKFNASDYTGAIEERQAAEYITSVLYPNDNTDSGKELRLKQQYFFVRASLQDLLRSHQSEVDDFAVFLACRAFPLGSLTTTACPSTSSHHG